jgi:RHS repeat-associated protein
VSLDTTYGDTSNTVKGLKQFIQSHYTVGSGTQEIAEIKGEDGIFAYYTPDQYDLLVESNEAMVQQKTRIIVIEDESSLLSLHGSSGDVLISVGDLRTSTPNTTGGGMGDLAAVNPGGGSGNPWEDIVPIGPIGPTGPTTPVVNKDSMLLEYFRDWSYFWSDPQVPINYIYRDSVEENWGYHLQTELANLDFYIHDHLGNTRLTYRVGCNGLSVQKKLLHAADYFPYGKILREARSGAPERYLTTHHERDELSNLDYRFARFYDSDIGRFLSVDPLAADYASWSRYNYVMGNPIIFIDSDGMSVRPTSDDAWKILEAMLGSFGISKEDMGTVLNLRHKAGYEGVIHSNLQSPTEPRSMEFYEFESYIKHDIKKEYRKQMDLSKANLLLLYNVYQTLNDAGIYDFGVVEATPNKDGTYQISSGITPTVTGPDEKNKSTNANLNQFLDDLKADPQAAIRAYFGEQKIIMLPYSPNNTAQSQHQKAEEYGSIIYNMSGVNPYNRSQLLKEAWYNLNSGR